MDRQRWWQKIFLRTRPPLNARQLRRAEWIEDHRLPSVVAIGLLWAALSGAFTWLIDNERPFPLTMLVFALWGILVFGPLVVWAVLRGLDRHRSEQAQRQTP